MATSQDLQVLIFSATAPNGYRHASIPAGIAALRRLDETRPDARFTTEATEDAAIFAPEHLARFAVIVLLQTSGDFLSPTQLDALKGFVHGGGGVVAIHGASTGLRADTSDWYARLIGAVFHTHPKPQQGLVHIVDTSHLIVAQSLGRGSGMSIGEGGGWQWRWLDEWYNFKAQPSSNTHVLMTVDEQSYTGGTHGQYHPIAWCQEFEGGRSFYTAMGHFDEAYQDPGFLDQLRDGIWWTAKTPA